VCSSELLVAGPTLLGLGRASKGANRAPWKVIAGVQSLTRILGMNANVRASLEGRIWEAMSLMAPASLWVSFLVDPLGE